MRTRTRAIAIALVTLGAVMVGAPAAQAATNCNEYHDGENFPTGLIATGPDCFVKNAVVTGDVTVKPGAVLFLGYSTVKGSVSVKSGGEADLEGNKITGDVTTNGGVIHIGDSGKVTGDVSSTNGAASATSDPFGFQFSVLICNTRIGGSLTVTGATDDVVVGDDANCGPNRVVGNAILNNNQDGVAFVNGPLQYCNTSVIGNCGVVGNVTANGNQGSAVGESESAEIAFNKIGGDLKCLNNQNGVTDDASSETSNIVAGTTSGQCRGL